MSTFLSLIIENGLVKTDAISAGRYDAGQPAISVLPEIIAQERGNVLSITHEGRNLICY
jgi:hypothetical protein